jgi:hypothetical protein
MATEPFFQSEIPFNTSRIGAAAIYCSDGRYGDQMDDLLHLGCGWPRYDRLAFPGGPASLSAHLSVFWEESTLRKYLEFLVRTHDLTRLALIQHEDCGFYREWLRIPGDQIEDHQRADLVSARRRILKYLPGLEVFTFFACKQDDRVKFLSLNQDS